MYAWLRSAPTAVLRRAEDLAVAQAQRYFEAGRPREALQECRIARVFGSELNRRGER
jgi:ABC-type cobalamin/Fe3+-siderophores transport system ATPase subunit